MAIVTPRVQFSIPVQRLDRSCTSVSANGQQSNNGKGLQRGLDAGQESQCKHEIALYASSSLLNMTFSGWELRLMAEPSYQDLSASYSQVTAELPTATRDLSVAAGLFCSFLPVSLALCGPL